MLYWPITKEKRRSVSLWLKKSSIWLTEMKAIKIGEKEIKSRIKESRVLYPFTASPIRLFEILCSPEHKHSKTDQHLKDILSYWWYPNLLLIPPLHTLIRKYIILNELYKKLFKLKVISTLKFVTLLKHSIPLNLFKLNNVSDRIWYIFMYNIITIKSNRVFLLIFGLDHV